MSSNKKKDSQLGMPYGTACHKLRRNIMFELVKVCGLDNCYICGDVIESVRQLSIEHKTPWLDSEDPLELFWDLSNIAFSHLSCNSGTGQKVTKKVIRSDGTIYDSIKEASDDNDVWCSEICRICKGVGKTAGGYGWQYA